MQAGQPAACLRDFPVAMARLLPTSHDLGPGTARRQGRRVGGRVGIAGSPSPGTLMCIMTSVPANIPAK